MHSLSQRRSQQRTDAGRVRSECDPRAGAEAPQTEAETQRAAAAAPRRAAAHCITSALQEEERSRGYTNS